MGLLREAAGFEVVVGGEVVGGLAWFELWLFNVGYYGADVALYAPLVCSMPLSPNLYPPVLTLRALCNMP